MHHRCIIDIIIKHTIRNKKKKQRLTSCNIDLHVKDFSLPEELETHASSRENTRNPQSSPLRKAMICKRQSGLSWESREAKEGVRNLSHGIRRLWRYHPPPSTLSGWKILLAAHPLPCLWLLKPSHTRIRLRRGKRKQNEYLPGLFFHMVSLKSSAIKNCKSFIASFSLYPNIISDIVPINFVTICNKHSYSTTLPGFPRNRRKKRSSLWGCK